MKRWFKEWGWLVWIGLISIVVGLILYVCLHNAMIEIEEKGLKAIIEGTWYGKQ